MIAYLMTLLKVLPVPSIGENEKQEIPKSIFKIPHVINGGIIKDGAKLVNAMSNSPQNLNFH